MSLNVWNTERNELPHIPHHTHVISFKIQILTPICIFSRVVYLAEENKEQIQNEIKQTYNPLETKHQTMVRKNLDCHKYQIIAKILPSFAN